MFLGRGHVGGQSETDSSFVETSFAVDDQRKLDHGSANVVGGRPVVFSDNDHRHGTDVANGEH